MIQSGWSTSPNFAGHASTKKTLADCHSRQGGWVKGNERKSILQGRGCKTESMISKAGYCLLPFVPFKPREAVSASRLVR